MESSTILRTRAVTTRRRTISHTTSARTEFRYAKRPGGVFLCFAGTNHPKKFFKNSIQMPPMTHSTHSAESKRQRMCSQMTLFQAASSRFGASKKSCIGRIFLSSLIRIARATFALRCGSVVVLWNHPRPMLERIFSVGPNRAA